MSIFSKIRGAKKAAEEHKKAKAAADDTPKKVPYKHVPTHAAQDAMLGAPTAWTREDNRAKIKALNKRKSGMTIPQSASESTMAPEVPSLAGSQYRGSQYGGSQYGGSQYGGSQYGGSQYGSELSMKKAHSTHLLRPIAPKAGAGGKQRMYFSHNYPHCVSSTPSRKSPLATSEISADGSFVKSSQDSFRTDRSSSGSSQALEMRTPRPRGAPGPSASKHPLNAAPGPSSSRHPLNAATHPLAPYPPPTSPLPKTPEVPSPSREESWPPPTSPLPKTPEIPLQFTDESWPPPTSTLPKTPEIPSRSREEAWPPPTSPLPKPPEIPSQFTEESWPLPAAPPPEDPRRLNFGF